MSGRHVGSTQADFTGDARTDASDFNIWSANRFMPAAAASPAQAKRTPRAAAERTETRIDIAIIHESTDNSRVGARDTSESARLLSNSTAQTASDAHDQALRSRVRWYANVSRRDVMRSDTVWKADVSRRLDVNVLDSLFEKL